MGPSDSSETPRILRPNPFGLKTQTSKAIRVNCKEHPVPLEFCDASCDTVGNWQATISRSGGTSTKLRPQGGQLGGAVHLGFPPRRRPSPEWRLSPGYGGLADTFGWPHLGEVVRTPLYSIQTFRIHPRQRPLRRGLKQVELGRPGAPPSDWPIRKCPHIRTRCYQHRFPLWVGPG